MQTFDLGLALRGKGVGDGDPGFQSSHLVAVLEGRISCFKARLTKARLKRLDHLAQGSAGALRSLSSIIGLPGIAGQIKCLAQTLKVNEQAALVGLSLPDFALSQLAPDGVDARVRERCGLGERDEAALFHAMHLPGSCRACSSSCTAMPCKCLELHSLPVAHATQPLCRCRANARQHGGVNASLTSNAQICAVVPALDGNALKVEPARTTRRVE